MVLVVVCVNFQVAQIQLGEVVIGPDGVDGSHRNSRAAVDAGVGDDVEHFVVYKTLLGRGGVNAVDRAYRRARGVVAAALGDYVWHLDVSLSRPLAAVPR